MDYIKKNLETIICAACVIGLVVLGAIVYFVFMPH